jgi:hypothetical protein
MLPLLAIGAIAMVRLRRQNHAYGLLAAWLLLYPIAGALTTSGPHALRSACGLGMFQWIGAIGACGLVSAWPRRWGPPVVATAIIAVVVTLNATWAAYRYFGVFARHPYVHALYQTDLKDAVEFIRDRWRDYDRVFITDNQKPENAWFSFEPYTHVLLYLPVRPEAFQSWDTQISYDPPPHHYFHVVDSMGPFVMSMRPDVLRAHFENRRDERALFVGRPGDLRGGTLLHTVRDSRGRPRFEIIEVLPMGRTDPESARREPRAPNTPLPTTTPES